MYTAKLLEVANPLQLICVHVTDEAGNQRLKL